MSGCLVGGAASLLEEENNIKKMHSVAVWAAWRGSTLSLYSRFLMRFVHLGESFSFFRKRWLIFLFFCFVELSCSRWWLFGATLAESKWRECPQVIWSVTHAPAGLFISVDWVDPFALYQPYEKEQY